MTTLRKRLEGNATIMKNRVIIGRGVHLLIKTKKMVNTTGLESQKNHVFLGRAMMMLQAIKAQVTVRWTQMFASKPINVIRRQRICKSL